MPGRHSRQRERRAALKADAVVLLDRIAALGMNEPERMPPSMLLQIAEMRMRLAPAIGVKAPIVRTGYTKGPR